MSGWVKAHRKLLENPIVCKDSDYLAVWMYLMLNASHKEHPAVFGGQKITLQPGQLITGRKSIGEKFKIDQSKVQRILKAFENEHQIEQQTGNKNRLITVLSWDEYQSNEHQDEQPVNNKRTTTEQQLNTNKNEKNVENERTEEKEEEKKNTRQRKTLPEDSPPYKLALYFLSKINEWTDEVKKPNMQTWADDCRKILELDDRDKHQIKEVIDWVTSDSFWRKNVLSPDKLRKQFPRLVISMQEEKQKALREIQNGQQQTAAGRGRNGAPQKPKLAVVPDMPKGPVLPPEELAELYRLAEKADAESRKGVANG